MDDEAGSVLLRWIHTFLDCSDAVDSLMLPVHDGTACYVGGANVTGRRSMERA